MDSSNARQRILFVCLGNICRSPLAEGVFRDLLRQHRLTERFAHDSAGTGHWHVGSPPDERAILCAREHGIDISDLRARQVTPNDFDQFDRILAMDAENLAALAARRPPRSRARVELFREYDPLKRADRRSDSDVPDPYAGGPEQFEQVFTMVERTALELLAHLRREIGSAAP